ncbi:MAG: hypothetical protein OXI94_09730 [Gemmatimonadota bacterium]|nr:hypothetical protein [Gemmatimonadota bacterium]
MARTAVIVLILSMCMPEVSPAEMVLEAGEIDSSKVKVGVYAEVIYGTGERDQVSGKWERLDTVRGYIKAVDAESLTIRRGFWKEQIVFERIQKLTIAESDREIDRLKETTDSPSVRKENGYSRMTKKLGCGALVGFLSGIVGTGIAAAMDDCQSEDLGCFVPPIAIGGGIGWVVGVPVGVSLCDPHDRFTYSLAGSLIGSTVSLAVLKMDEKIAEDLWPALVISPLIGAAILSELFRKPLEDRRVSIGLLPGPKGSVFAVATLRY